MKFSLSKTEIIIFALIGVVISAIPYIMTRDLNLISFKETGSIGDTIGGITAPFLSFFGSILVYLALKAQIDANRLVQNQFIKQENEEVLRKKTFYYDNKISLLKDEINEFYFSFMELSLGKNQKLNYQGSQAIYKLLNKNKVTFIDKSNTELYSIEPKFLELKHLLIFFDETVQSIKNENFESDVQSNFYYVLRYYFNSKIQGNFKAMEKYKSKHTTECPKCCNTLHGLPDELFDLVNRIEIGLL